MKRIIVGSLFMTVFAVMVIVTAFALSPPTVRGPNGSVAAASPPTTDASGHPLFIAGPSRLPPGPPTAPQVMKVDFRNNLYVLVDAQQNLQTKAPVAITEWKGNDEIEWKAETGKVIKVIKNWPVAYPQEKKIKLEAQFELEPGTRNFLETSVEKEVTITGELTLGSTTFTFTKKYSALEIKEQAEKNQTYLTTGVVESNNSLPREVRIYEGAAIKWKWEGTEVGGAAFSQKLGESKHNIFTTYTPPVQKLNENEIYFTLLYMTTHGIEQESHTPSEAQAIKGAWSEFTTRSVHPVSYNLESGAITVLTSVVLQFYFNVPLRTLEKEVKEEEKSVCTVSSVKELLENNDHGQCGAWARAFAYTLGYEGIHSKVEEIRTNFPECKAVDACVFLVNNWQFKCGGATNGGNFPYPSREVLDLEGVPGQGTTNPPAKFTNHFIVRVTKTLYDPSYGSTPVEGATEAESLKKYQEASMAGYCSTSTWTCLPEDKKELRLKEELKEEY
jgi:hypothetical protein